LKSVAYDRGTLPHAAQTHSLQPLELHHFRKRQLGLKPAAELW